MLRIARHNVIPAGIMDVRVRAPASGASAGNGLLNTLIAYWPGNEASGDAQDAHTNALHLTDINAVTNAAGKVYATARKYTAIPVVRHERPGDDAPLSTGDVDYTLAAWMWLDTKTSTMYGPSKWVIAAGAREYALTYVATSYRWRWLVSSNGTAFTALLANNSGAVSTEQWYFVVGWHDAANNQLGIQINNGTADTVAYSGGSHDSASRFSISSSAGYWNGRIGPTMFWKSVAGGGGVLSATQRTALYNAGAGLPYASFTV